MFTMCGDTEIKEEVGALEEGDFCLVHVVLPGWSGQAEVHSGSRWLRRNGRPWRHVLSALGANRACVQSKDKELLDD